MWLGTGLESSQKTVLSWLILAQVSPDVRFRVGKAFGNIGPMSNEHFFHGLGQTGS